MSPATSTSSNTRFNVEAWKAICSVDVALYSLFLLLIIFPIFHIARVALKRFARIIILNSLILLTKIAGGAVMLYLLVNISSVSYNAELNMVIASAVLMNISQGLLISSISIIVQYINHLSRGTPDKGMSLKQAIITLANNISGRRLEAIEAIHWRVVLVTIIVASVGGGISSSNFEAAKTLSKVASILYVVELVILAFLITNALKSVFSADARKKKYLSFLIILSAVDTVFLTFRIAAFVASSFTMTHPAGISISESKFSFFFGNWKWYAFLSFLPETIATGIWALIFWCLFKHLKYDGSGSKADDAVLLASDESA